MDIPGTAMDFSMRDDVPPLDRDIEGTMTTDPALKKCLQFYVESFISFTFWHAVL